MFPSLRRLLLKVHPDQLSHRPPAERLANEDALKQVLSLAASASSRAPHHFGATTTLAGSTVEFVVADGRRVRARLDPGRVRACVASLLAQIEGREGVAPPMHEDDPQQQVQQHVQQEPPRTKKEPRRRGAPPPPPKPAFTTRQQVLELMKRGGTRTHTAPPSAPSPSELVFQAIITGRILLPPPAGGQTLRTLLKAMEMVWEEDPLLAEDFLKDSKSRIIYEREILFPTPLDRYQVQIPNDISAPELARYLTKWLKSAALSST